VSAFAKSLSAYDAWLERELRGELVFSDLDYKHKKMRSSAFAFLRATYWRWAEIIFDVCPTLRDDPRALCVGDIHLENFGVWRDLDDRLVWGVNDFDEASVMPFSLDLVRLATSALLLKQCSMSASEVCGAIESGYRHGLATPNPTVLERDNKALRDWITKGEPKRRSYWRAFERLKREQPDKRFAAALKAAMPGPADAVCTARLAKKGLGSLGRPRWVAFGEWRGGPFAREAKAIVPSAWSRHHAPRETKIRWREIVEGRYRSPDPWLKVTERVVVRRTAPHSRKIEMKEEIQRRIAATLLKAMGRELASLHRGTNGAGTQIREALHNRARGWLKKAAKEAATAVTTEWKAYRDG
jgi:Uncharacterized protein conserved in bacteria (DUF2252)